MLDHPDAGETLGAARPHQPRRHGVDDLLRHHARPRAVALLADLRRNVEKQRLRLETQALCHQNVGPALGRSQVRGVDVGDRPAEADALAQQIADRGEDLGMQRLVGLIVGQQFPQLVGGKRRQVVLPDVSRFARARQPHQDDDAWPHGSQTR